MDIASSSSTLDSPGSENSNNQKENIPTPFDKFFNNQGQKQSNDRAVIKGPSPKYRGVLWLKSGKWGARISFKYKPYWLGTYKLQEEAAMAYDRAAIKLQRGDIPLNFPMGMYTVQETQFQSRFTSEEVLEMIKDKTYLSKFTYCIASQAMTSMDHEANNLANLQGRSYQLLFQKELTLTDVTHIKGLHIAKEYASAGFPQLPENDPLVAGADVVTAADDHETKSIELTFYDKHTRPWTFRYSFWKSTQTFVFTKGWRHFLKMNNLNPRDIVLFYKCEERDRQRVFYMIDIRRHDRETYVVGPKNNITEQVRRFEVSNYPIETVAHNDDVATTGREGERTSEKVKLFGVQIGKRKRSELDI